MHKKWIVMAAAGVLFMNGAVTILKAEDPAAIEEKEEVPAMVRGRVSRIDHAKKEISLMDETLKKEVMVTVDTNTAAVVRVADLVRVTLKEGEWKAQSVFIFSSRSSGGRNRTLFPVYDPEEVSGK